MDAMLWGQVPKPPLQVINHRQLHEENEVWVMSFLC
jgi:hypothetical protein